MALLLADNAVTTLSAGISNSDTVLTTVSGTGAVYPVLNGGSDFIILTLENASGLRENVKCNYRNGDIFGSVTYPLTRAYGGTTARAWNAGDIVDIRLCAQAFAEISKASAISHTATSENAATDMQAAIANCVSKTGSTMMGFLTLHADPDAALKAATKQYVDAKFTSNLPAGATTIWYSNTAPTGWTKVTTAALDNTALRIVSDGSQSGGNGGVTGGSATFNAVFGASKSTGSTAADLAAHTHTYSGTTGNDSPDHTHAVGNQGTLGARNDILHNTYAFPGSAASGGASARHTHAYSGTSSSAGAGGGHAHTINFDVRYAAFIVATKDAY